MHLIIDGYGGDPQQMQDEALILQLLDRYPSQIGMKKIAPPSVLRYIGEKPEDWGISGFVLIAESHISIHTFPEKAYINIDIFSCKPFDAEGAAEVMRREFGLAAVKTYLLERGLEYPTSLEAAAEVVAQERLQVAPTR